MNERLIVSLTTYNKRIRNIPVVLETIFQQTVRPDFVVLNLAEGERVPEEVQRYIDTHPIEILWGPDTKVYKKLLPTLRKYPDDCVISIDDDFLYPIGMIEDFMDVHRHYPDFPISGNRTVIRGLQCHCGCASLMKATYFGSYLQQIDETVMANCSSDDFVYTYFANKNGCPYVRTRGMYFSNMPSYNEVDSYTLQTNIGDGIHNTLVYLTSHFGELENSVPNYLKDKKLNELMDDIVASHKELGFYEGLDYVYASKAYQLGEALLKPFRLLDTLLSRR